MRPIDADALIEVVEKSMAENPHKEKTQRAMHIHEHKYFLTLLAGIPTIQPEPHEGRFERKRDGVFCSVCHYGWEFITGVPAEVEREYHYCPNCGADMRGEQDG